MATDDNNHLFEDLAACCCAGALEQLASLLAQAPDLDINRPMCVEPCSGLTLLHRATQHEYAAIVKLLLNVPGIDVNKPIPPLTNQPYAGINALALAVHRASVPVVSALINHPQIDVRAPGVDGLSCLQLATIKGQADLLGLILQTDLTLEEVTATFRSDQLQGDDVITDAIRAVLGTDPCTAEQAAVKLKFTGCADLLRAYREDRDVTRHVIRFQFGLPSALAAATAADMNSISHGPFEIRLALHAEAYEKPCGGVWPYVHMTEEESVSRRQARRVFSIAARLPWDLQLILSAHIHGAMRDGRIATSLPNSHTRVAMTLRLKPKLMPEFTLPCHTGINFLADRWD
jgi:hypothetical protein